MSKIDYYDISVLLKRYLDCTASESEVQEVEAWIAENPEHEKLLQSFADPHIRYQLQFMSNLDVDKAWDDFELKRNKYNRKKSFYKLGAAAAVLIMGFLLLFHFKHQHEINEIKKISHNQFFNDLSPADIKAELHLSDGSKWDLGSDTFYMAEKDGTLIKRDSESLVYNKVSDWKEEILGIQDTELYNTIIVPKAGTYTVQLSDGTRVYLNANSELQFPVAFKKNQRVIKLKGEAYFEVAPNPDKPFIVEINNKKKIQVIGTSFNVNAYKKDVKTTLISGSVKISNNKESTFLKPGESGILPEHSNKPIKTYQENLDKILSWKNGDFLFKSEDLGEIMDELSRWYDVEVKYSETLSKDKLYSGSIRRNVNISEVLGMLSHVSGAHFLLEGNVIKVNLNNINP